MQLLSPLLPFSLCTSWLGQEHCSDGRGRPALTSPLISLVSRRALVAQSASMSTFPATGGRRRFSKRFGYAGGPDYATMAFALTAALLLIVTVLALGAPPSHGGKPASGTSPRAVVEARSPSAGVLITRTSSRDRLEAFVLPGTYRVTAKLAGYRCAPRNVDVQAPKTSVRVTCSVA